MKVTRNNLMKYLGTSEEVAQKIVQQIRANTDNPHTALDAIDKLLGTCGVEGVIKPSSYSEGLSYCNTGETYDNTVCFDSEDNTWFIGSWGDWYEQNTEDTNDEYAHFG